MYKNATLLVKPPTFDTVIKAHRKGICASFACDWLKKLLASKPINESTYEEVKRINKMVGRQKTYEKDGDLNTIAGLYGLKIEHMRGLMYERNSDEQDDFPGYFKGLPAGYYYLSLYDPASGGHALGYDKHTGQFCDANYGVADMNGRPLVEFLSECKSYLADDGIDIKSVSVYQMKLGK
jgi:hypothetical protein